MHVVIAALCVNLYMYAYHTKMKLFALVISPIGIEPCVMSMHRMKQRFMFAVFM